MYCWLKPEKSGTVFVNRVGNAGGLKYKHDGYLCEGFAVWDDAGTKRPGILVFPEWGGVGEYTHQRAQMLGELGFDAGQLVGSYYIGSTYKGYLYSDGVYTTLIDPSQNVGGETVPVSINASGQVIGFYSTGPTGAGYNIVGFTYSNGIYTTLVDPSAYLGVTTPTAINASGQVVGYYVTGSTNTGFLYSSGVYTTLTDPSASGDTTPLAINALGQVVGYYSNHGLATGFLYSQGVYTDLNDPLAAVGGGTLPTAINDVGQVVGFYGTPTATAAGFIYSDGTYTTLIDPLAVGAVGGGGGTYPTSINDAGQVVGYYYNGTTNVGFLYSHGVYTDLNDPSEGVGDGSLAISINNLGQIIGVYNNGSTQEGFLATPNPTILPDRTHVQEGYSVTADAAHGVLANDSDPIPNDALTVSEVGSQASNVGIAVAGAYGTLTLNANGSYTYVATPHDKALPSDGVGLDTFTYTAKDEAGGTATTTLTVVVTAPGKTYLGGTANTTINGRNGQQVLDGGAGNDVVIAGTGKQVLIGGPGDTLTGGSGADTFVFPPNFGNETDHEFDAERHDRPC